MIHGIFRPGAALSRARRRMRAARPAPFRAAGRLFGAGGIVWLAAISGGLPGCAAPQAMLIKSGLDSLRTEVATMRVRDSLAYETLSDMQRELQEQRDILLSTRAATGSTTREMFDQMERLEARLGEVMGRFQRVSERTSAPPAAGGADATQLYDQAAQDLTQGRYEMALQSFRDVVRQFPASELADNAQYGVGECFFAMARFDSASVAYAAVGMIAPNGDRVPASLFKLALSQEKEGKDAVSRKTLEDLVNRFPNAGEAQLARERLGTARRR
jgi:tol-pal system protein YbgF